MTQDEIKEAATRLGCWAMPYAKTGKSEDHNRAVVALVQEMVQAERQRCMAACDEAAIQAATRARSQQ